MATFDFKLATQMHHFYEKTGGGNVGLNARYPLLMYLSIRANGERITWPSRATMIKDTKFGKGSIDGALDWLAERGAIYEPTEAELAKFKIGKNSLARCVTGLIRLDDEIVRYLFTKKEAVSETLARLEKTAPQEVINILNGVYADEEEIEIEPCVSAAEMCADTELSEIQIKALMLASKQVIQAQKNIAPNTATTLLSKMFLERYKRDGLTFYKITDRGRLWLLQREIGIVTGEGGQIVTGESHLHSSELESLELESEDSAPPDGDAAMASDISDKNSLEEKDTDEAGDTPDKGDSQEDVLENSPPGSDDPPPSNNDLFDIIAARGFGIEDGGIIANGSRIGKTRKAILNSYPDIAPQKLSAFYDALNAVGIQRIKDPSKTLENLTEFLQTGTIKSAIAERGSEKRKVPMQNLFRAAVLSEILSIDDERVQQVTFTRGSLSKMTGSPDDFNLRVVKHMDKTKMSTCNIRDIQKFWHIYVQSHPELITPALEKLRARHPGTFLSKKKGWKNNV